jgi:hypothetical protein
VPLSTFQEYGAWQMTINAYRVSTIFFSDGNFDWFRSEIIDPAEPYAIQCLRGNDEQKPAVFQDWCPQGFEPDMLIQS